MKGNDKSCIGISIKCFLNISLYIIKIEDFLYTNEPCLFDRIVQDLFISSCKVLVIYSPQKISNKNIINPNFCSVLAWVKFLQIRWSISYLTWPYKCSETLPGRFNIDFLAS